jgi:hypothetical protein
MSMLTRTMTLAAVLAVAGCGNDPGATSDAGFQQPLQGGSGAGGGGQTPFTIVVSAAVPASGNGIVAGTGARALPATGTLRQVEAFGVAGATKHRFFVLYDAVGGTVFSAAHAWGPTDAYAEAATQCTSGAPTLNVAQCGTTVAVDPATRVVTFRNALLLGQGTFTSVLNGQLTFSAP